MLNNFKSQANITVFNIDFNILAKYRPVVFSDNQLSSFVNSKIVYKRIVIVAIDQLRSNNFRNVKEVLILEHSFNIFLALKKIHSLEFACLFVIILQIWKF